MQPGNNLSIDTFDHLRETWESVERSCPSIYFQSSSWQHTWHELGQKHAYRPRIALLATSSQPRALTSFSIRRQYYLKVWPVRALYFNSSGRDSFDVVCSEHCEPLLPQGEQSEVLTELFRALRAREGIDEFVIRAVPLSMLEHFEVASASLGLQLVEEKRAPNYWVNLQRLRSEKQSYLMTLKPRTRRIVKNDFEGYIQKFGSLSVTRAAGVAEAIQWFDSLAQLNVQRLTQKGIKSSFNLPFLKEFHHRLITYAFDKGEIELLKISFGQQTLGYVYGFLCNSEIFVYQSGFDFSLDPQLRPGLITHHCAIEHYFARGLNRYDFLAGEYQYKRSLSNEQDTLLWLRIRSRKAVFTIDSALREFKRKLLTKLRGQQTEAEQ